MIQTALMTLLLLGAPLQEPPHPTPDPDPSQDLGREAAPPTERWIPGALPADVPPAAAERWRALCAAVGADSHTERLRAFDLEFEGRAFSGEGQSNDFNIKRFLYLDPGWVRMTLTSGRVRLRGPDGDFLLDTKRGTSVRLRGKELAADIRELDETVRIARSFVALMDPGSIRIAELGLGTAPANLPARFAERAAKLEWLDLSSPDFHPAMPGTAAGREPLFRVRLGSDPKTHLPALAVIHEATSGVPRIETAMLLDLRKFRRLDGYQVPGRVLTHMPDATRSPWVFAERQSMELWLLEGTLAPQLSERDFLPPKQ